MASRYASQAFPTSPFLIPNSQLIMANHAVD